MTGRLGWRDRTSTSSRRCAVQRLAASGRRSATARHSIPQLICLIAAAQPRTTAPHSAVVLVRTTLLTCCCETDRTAETNDPRCRGVVRFQTILLLAAVYAVRRRKPTNAPISSTPKPNIPNSAGSGTLTLLRMSSVKLWSAPLPQVHI